MDTSDSENVGDTDLEKFNKYRAYFKNRVRCFLPSCKKFSRDHTNTTFLAIPKTLKATWCLAVDINCPKRTLYVCEDHVDIEQDCYKSKDGKIHLKNTANLVLLTRTHYENKISETCDGQTDAVLPGTTDQMTNIMESSSSKADSASQYEYKKVHKFVMAKPAVRSIGCSANFKAQPMLEKIMPSQHGFCSSSTSGCSTPIVFEPTSPSSTSSNKENIPERKKDLCGRYHITKIIKEKPKTYIGVPTQYCWFVDFIAKQCELNPLHVMVAFFKIKQNDTLERIGDHFNLSVLTVQEVLKVSFPRLATYLQNFIYLPEPLEIKKTLPPVFKARYANVQCIIDCFEIEIEKPSDPINQARTWSQYKSCNTLKYLIACCPNGFICFISKGYGGRISDKAITECSGFVDILPPGAVVLADRGFKGIECLLKDRHLKLLRPPSVMSKETPTKREVIQSKIIASLRIHVERVIRRVREFRFLKPHAVVNHSHITYVDECVIIACALANLQGNIIKTQ